MSTRGMVAALAAVEQGALQVRPDGTIWRVKAHGLPCEPRRAENLSKKGYLRLTLNVGNRRTACVQAHRVVWTVLRGPIPEGLQINHMDSNKANNHPENLEVVTGSRNMQHSYESGRVAPWTHSTEWRPGRPRLGEDVIAKARLMRADRKPTSAIAKELGISRTHADRITKDIPVRIRKQRSVHG